MLPTPPSFPGSATPSSSLPAELLRPAGTGDLEALLSLEIVCFDPDRRDSPGIIRRSLSNPRHEIWVLVGSGGGIDAALFLRHLGKTLRIHSLATRPDRRGRGLGGLLLGLAESRARAAGRARLVLEADDSLSDLLSWYGRLGFFRVLHLPSFYAPGRGAWRLRRDLGPDATS